MLTTPPPGNRLGQVASRWIQAPWNGWNESGVRTAQQLLTASFSASPVTGTVPLTVTFTNQSSPTSTITSYLWQFGDGTTSVITHLVHVYTSTGAYTVTLTAYAGAAQGTLTRTNYITVTSGSVEPVLITTTIRYAYDPLQRLTGATYSDGKSFQYQYDAVGNRTISTQIITSTLVTTYQYDAANRLTSVNGQAYTWDNNPAPLRFRDSLRSRQPEK